MNHSIYSADRMTHVKVVVIALVAGIGVAGLGIAAHINAGDGYAQIVPILKAKVSLQDRKFAIALPASIQQRGFRCSAIRIRSVGLLMEALTLSAREVF